MFRGRAMLTFGWAILFSWCVSERLAEAQAENTTVGDFQVKSIAAAAKTMGPSVVNIQSKKKMEMGSNEENPFYDFFEYFGPQFKQFKDNPKEFFQEGQGSGFIVDERGYILTNNHVVGDADEVRVILQDKREFKAKVIGADPASDIAVIKIEADNLVPAKLGESAKLEVGSPVLAVGNPFGFDHTVTFGIVSAIGRWFPVSEGVEYSDYIQTDAAINPGNSGGPLCNLDGEVVGINVAIYSRSGGYMGIGFAIPIDMAKGNMQQLIDKGKVVRGWLGVSIQSLSPDLVESLGYKGTQGALVGQVFDGSPSQKAGVEKGDIITEFNGTQIDDSHHLMNMVSNVAPGSKVTLVVFRNGDQKRLTVILDERPASTAELQPGAGPSESETFAKLGMEVQDLTQELASELGYESKKGVVVANVAQGSDAARKGVQPGDLIDEVDRTPIDSVEGFKKAIANAKEGKVLLHVTNRQGSIYVVLPLSDK